MLYGQLFSEKVISLQAKCGAENVEYSVLLDLIKGTSECAAGF